MKLKTLPDREGEQEQGTGIYVRAQDSHGKWINADIAQLDPESLLIWLRSRDGNNPWAEDVVGILLGHGHLHKKVGQ